MEQIDVSDGFDVHEYRHGLKLLREDRGTTHLENRDGFACPACGKPFEELLVIERQTTSLGNPDAPFCLARTEDEMLLFVH